MDREHQRNKPDKGHSEKTEFNERRLRREGAVLKNEHIWKNIPTLYNSWTNSIYSQPPLYNYIWQQQTTREHAKILYLSSFRIKEPRYMLGGCNRKGFQSFEQLRFKTLQLFVPNSKRLGYTQWVHFFLQKSAQHSEDFFKTAVFEQLRFKTLQLFVPNSKRLESYTQWVHFFFKKAHITRKNSSRQSFQKT